MNHGIRLRVPLAAFVAVVAVFASSCASLDDTSTTSIPVEAGEFFKGVDGVSTSTADSSRIVSLNGDITETIFALGGGDRVVGVDLTTTFPVEATQVASVGLGRDLNAEAVIRLSPSLVIGDTQVAPASAIQQIRDAGIPVVILQTEVTLDGVLRKITNIGRILGLEAEAANLGAGVSADIDEALALAGKATRTPRVAYIYVRGPETLLLFGNGMPTHFLIEAAHAIDAAGEADVLFAENLSAELLVTAAPDVLLTPTEGLEIIGGIDSFLALPGVADTPAGASHAVLDYDEALLLGMGPRVGQALRKLILDLHPEIDG